MKEAALVYPNALYPCIRLEKLVKKAAKNSDTLTCTRQEFEPALSGM
jgi:hypothetical protein